MSVFFLKLTNVPQDEADDVRALLDEHDIAYYETHAGVFGTSVAAIWLEEKDQLVGAKELLADYQNERTSKAREEYQQLLSENQVETFADRLRAQPLKVSIYLIAVAIILYITIVPFITIGR